MSESTTLQVRARRAWQARKAREEQAWRERLEQYRTRAEETAAEAIRRTLQLEATPAVEIVELDPDGSSSEVRATVDGLEFRVFAHASGRRNLYLMGEHPDCGEEHPRWQVGVTGGPGLEELGRILAGETTPTWHAECPTASEPRAVPLPEAEHRSPDEQLGDALRGWVAANLAVTPE